MEAIKIYQLNESVINSSHLTEDENETLFCSIIEALNDRKNNEALNTIIGLSEYVTPFKDRNELVKPIPVIMNGLEKWIRNEYALKVKKMYDHSKELNDLYNKVDALLESDKMVKFKHRNDLITVTVKDTYLLDVKTRKQYSIQYSWFAYDPDSFIKVTEDMIAKSKALGKDYNIIEEKNEILTALDSQFKRDYWFLVDCKPVSVNMTYNKVKLKHGLDAYKKSFENYYQFIYYCNKVIEAELMYIQLMQKAYSNMISRYGSDKTYKKVIDDMFTMGIKHMTIGLDYNNQILEISDENIKYYADAIGKIYDYLRNS